MFIVKCILLKDFIYFMKMAVKKNILLLTVLAVLISLCLVFASCDSGSSDSSDPTPVSVTYTVSFDANGGSGTMEDAIVEKGAEYTTPASTFTAPAFTAKTGAVPATHKNFAGWNTKADGTGDKYAAGKQIAAVSEDVTLYAQWANPVFTVADDKKVYFAKGNLYWDGAFKIYEMQTDLETTWNANKVDKFYWSKDAENAYAKDYNYLATTSGTDTFFAANSGAIDGWNVLSGGSNGEWKYLLDTRTDSNRFAKAMVGSVKGLLIFPDSYTLPDGYTTAGGGTGMAKVNKTSSSDAPFPTVKIPDATWTEMEAAGVVFLLAAGGRGGSGVDGVGSGGLYWSSTPYVSLSAYDLYFGSSDMYPDDDMRVFGYTVRLVVAEN